MSCVLSILASSVGWLPHFEGLAVKEMMRRYGPRLRVAWLATR